MPESSSSNIPPALVALAGWIVPGAGYWLLGLRVRGLTIGITIVILFVAGLLIGGIRLIEVPGWGDHGQVLVVTRSGSRDSQRNSADEVVEERSPADPSAGGWVMQVHPLDEIRNKPWFIAQVLAGPIDLAACWGSIAASRVKADGNPVGYRSHSRTNELGVLYTAVAGMLNLLAIIDSASRAGRAEETE